jgi:hypothetical protein
MDTKIEEQIEQLRKLGKDKGELELWKNLLPTMTETEKQELYVSLNEEINLMTAE